MLVPDPRHAICWTTSSKRVSAAAARPVVTPIRQTASQNRNAPGLASVVGIAPAFSAGVAIRDHTNEGTALLLPPGKDSNNEDVQSKSAISKRKVGNALSQPDCQLLLTGHIAFPCGRPSNSALAMWRQLG
jgi:hypothetical protein